MVIVTYEKGFTLQYFTRQHLGGTDVACLFAPDGQLLLWFDTEVAERYPPHEIVKRIDAHMTLHTLMQEKEDS